MLDVWSNHTSLRIQVIGGVVTPAQPAPPSLHRIRMGLDGRRFNSTSISSIVSWQRCTRGQVQVASFAWRPFPIDSTLNLCRKTVAAAAQ